jgi:DNA polymerase-3 subunit alpha
MRVSGEEVLDLASARATFAKRLDILCASQERVSVAKLAELFKPYCGGKCAVVIHYRNEIGSAQLRLGEAWHISLPDGLLGDLRALLGEGNVKIAY